MSENERSTVTKLKRAVGGSMAADRSRRMRTQVLVDAGRAAIEAHRDAVVRDCDRALGILDRIEQWAEGGPSEMIERFREIFFLTYAYHDEMPGGGKDTEHKRATEELDRMYLCKVEICDIAVYTAITHAAGVAECPLDVAVSAIRDAVKQSNETQLQIGEEVDRAVDAAMGVNRKAVDAQARAEGALPATH